MAMESIRESREAEKLTEKRKRQILEAAIEVFAEKGYNGAKTKEIAERAGVSEGTVFKYFKTKKDILLSLLNTSTIDALNQMVLEAESEGKDLQEVLELLLRKYATFVKDNFELMKLIFYESQFHKDLRRGLLQKVYKKILRLFEDLISQKIKKGEFRQIDPKVAVRAFIGMVMATLLWVKMMSPEEGNIVDEEKLIHQFIDIFFNGIRKK
ncbi:MAG: hypothetical protein PWP45_306 [Tepidanaerobacteraceae bacterium]|nr:hypothetical protein [Tepidanaerobacteraceae bacterium]